MNTPDPTTDSWQGGLTHALGILQDAVDGFVACDSSFRILYLNSAAEPMFGRPKSELLGARPWEVSPDWTGSELEAQGRRVIDGHVPAVLRHFHPDLAIWLEVRISPAAWGGVSIWLKRVSQETAERTLCERALREKADELDRAQRLAGVGSWTWDLESDVVKWSDELHRLAGNDPSQIAEGSRGFERFHTPESFRRIQAAVRKSCEDGVPFEVEAEAVLPDGQHCWRIIRGEARRDAGGRIVGLCGTAQDITARRQAEEKLRVAHAELAAIHAHAPMIFLVVDGGLRVRKVNQAAIQFTGRSEADMIGLGPGGSIGCLNAVKDPRGCGYGPGCGACPLRLAVLDSILHQARHANIEAWLPVNGGDGAEERCFLAFTAPLELTGVREALVCAIDITERKRAEKAHLDSEYWLKESQRISQIGSYVLNCSRGTWTGSETLDEIFGIGEDYPRTVDSWRSLIHPEDREVMWDHFQRGVLIERRLFDREYRILRPADGQTRWVHGRGALVCDAAGAPSIMTGTIQDVTARRAVEEELHQAHKLDSLGRLAGGVAHDFNNLLTVINGYGDMLLTQLREGDPLRESVAEIRKAGERAAALTGQLLTFSRKQIVEPQPLDLNETIADNLKLLRRLVGEDIELETRLCPSLGMVVADPGQIHQVLLNLAANARDAMPRGGTLTIATSNEDLPDRDFAPPPNLAARPCVLLSVQDTGAGIPAKAREHVFDPFFTTKDKGAGTGLGLATVHAIVQQAGGAISFRTESGRGTTFLIYLPRTEVPVAGRETITGPSADLRGAETILIVEDQGAVRKLAVEMLRRYGYRILQASQGEEATLLAANYAGPIHLLLTDVVMPFMTGKELAERLKASHPAMKVVYMSGYASDVIARRGLLDPGLLYLAKPFTSESLALKVREALG